MTDCIYVRHGTTEYSQQNRFAGHQDIPIIGIEQERLTAAYKLIAQQRPTVLVHSPLLRAKQTVEYFTDQYEFEQVISEPLLIERDFGNLDGMLKTQENRLLLESERSAETLMHLQARIQEFIDRYRGFDHSLLVVGHSSYYRQLATLLSISRDHLECCEAITFRF
ncbi:histidine phosphatase family protein [Vibrio sp.]|uniref:Histidine phosphatase family protein n=1 Tax=Vibrio viridaestus TaxID=2487322 RepID=A0A3N9TCV6_9VIBR|nr:histidine phosphatase family protein [Vibrio viridaestus]MDC0610240.1 histidine phosphatase family protein [Vibrio sp.]RQW61899.1 histidine phosphatase family protein [Vibrio viridaestus]